MILLIMGMAMILVVMWMVMIMVVMWMVMIMVMNVLEILINFGNIKRPDNKESDGSQTGPLGPKLSILSQI